MMGMLLPVQKPTNFKVRRDGTVKVLDFGLAKAMAVRPQLTLFYVDLSVPQLYTFYGRGQVSTDAGVDNRGRVL